MNNITESLLNSILVNCPFLQTCTGSYEEFAAFQLSCSINLAHNQISFSLRRCQFFFTNVNSWINWLYFYNKWGGKCAGVNDVCKSNPRETDIFKMQWDHVDEIQDNPEKKGLRHPNISERRKKRAPFQFLVEILLNQPLCAPCHKAKTKIAQSARKGDQRAKNILIAMKSRLIVLPQRTINIINKRVTQFIDSFGDTDNNNSSMQL